MEKIMCIYRIVNIKNNKQYIGSAIDYNRRKRNHLNLLNKNKHHSIKLQNSYNKYGKESFVFEIIEIINNKNSIIESEQMWLSSKLPELNMTLIAGLNSSMGMKRSIETKEKIRQSLIGKSTSEKTKEKLRQHNLGKRQSEKTKKKRSLSLYKRIIEIKKSGEIIEWDSATVASDKLKINRKSIYRCLWGKRKTYKKSIWKYKKNEENEREN